MPLCPNCGKTKSRLGTHWQLAKECTHPDLSKQQKDIAIGVLMGDGAIVESSKNSLLDVTSTNEKYLNYLNKRFGVLGTNVRKTHEAGETEFGVSEVYRWTTRTHPFFNELRDWYDTGSKTWPSMKLNSTILKHLYVCDGHFNENRGSYYISITCNNESENKEKIEKMFSDFGLEISRWNKAGSLQLSLNHKNTKKFFDKIGEPLPGFRYKWPGEKKS